MTEVAEQRGLNVATVRAWINQDLIQARRDGRRWLLRRGDVERFLQQNPNLGRPRSSRRSETKLLGERPPTPEREGTRRYASGILRNGLPL